MATTTMPIPADVLRRLRLVCLDLPEAREEAAWTGIRWCIGRKNFAHVLTIEHGWPPAYARAAGTQGPACVLTFRRPAAMLEAPRFAQAPYFRPVWWPNIAGLVIDGGTDWDEAGRLLTDRYRLLAPRRLAERIQS